MSSIRMIVIGGFAAELSKDQIKARVLAQHPDKMGAAKFDKHFAWYKARCRKASTAEAILLDRLIALRDLRSGVAASDLGVNPHDTKFFEWLQPHLVASVVDLTEAVVSMGDIPADQADVAAA